MFLRTFGQFLLRVAEGLVSIALSIFFVLPTLSFLYIVNSAVRGIVWLRLKCVSHRGKLQLSSNGLDNIWGYAGNGNSRNVLNVVVYEEKIDAYRYRRLFEEKVLKHRTELGKESYSRLKQIFVKRCGFYCWEEDENFHINNHVVILPDDKVMGEDELMELLARLSLDMPDTHPQWQEVIVPSFRYDNQKLNSSNSNGQEQGPVQSVRILRFHHAYGDAGSWLLLYSHCMAGGDIPYSVNPLKGFAVPKWQKFLYYSSALVFGTTTLMRNIWYGTNVRFNRLVTPKYDGQRFFAWTPPINLQALKDVKDRTKTSIPTVIACAIASALRRFDTTFPSPKGGIGDLTDCGAVAAILPYPGLRLTNRFTIANLSLHTEKDLSRKCRLRRTQKACLDLIRSPEPILNFWAFSFCGIFPVAIQNLMMRSAGTSLVFSNLPGASEKFSLLGDGIESGGAWVPLLTCAGLTISAAGYRDAVRFCGSTDSACMSKPQLSFLLETILDEVNQMHWETCGSV